MSPRQRRMVATAVCVPAALVLLACSVALIRDYVATRRHAAGEKQRVAALEEAAKKDVSQSAALAAELDRQTTLSLRRVFRQKIAAGVLIAASVLFLAGAKWGLRAETPAAPDLNSVKLMRAAEASRLRTRQRGKAGKGRRAGCKRCAGDTADTASDLDLSFVDTVVAREGRGAEAAIPVLQAIQSHYGYLPDEALKRVCALTAITPAQIAGVSTFYGQFRRTPAGRHMVKVCHGTACHVSGARQITEEIHRYLAIAPGSDTDPQRDFTVDKVACLGCCSLAPVIMIDDTTVGRLTPTEACEAIEALRQEEQST
jgi:NADH:ubiquinone oxidoreductase subunit E